jgi:Zn-dependent M28 family amino/carboxypeptidase
MLLGFVGVLAWFGTVGAGFVPKPTPTPRPTPTPTLTPTPRPTPTPTLTLTSLPTPTLTPPVGRFDGQTAYRHVLAQVAIGPRETGSQGGVRTGDYIIAKLKDAGWQVEIQEFTYQGVSARNIIGRAGQGPVGIVGAHYDTRRRADNDPDPARRNEPVPGANDGASGVAVLLELARALNKPKLSREVWLVFFDTEDNGRLDGWEFIVGSRYMAEHLAVTPEFVIVADMIGDADQQIYKERNSTPALQDQIWQIAAQLGYSAYFVPDYKWSMIDDHTPFLQRGIPALDVIDFDYPYWHTTQDTADKVSPASLERVGRVLQTFLESP